MKFKIKPYLWRREEQKCWLRNSWTNVCMSVQTSLWIVLYFTYTLQTKVKRGKWLRKCSRAFLNFTGWSLSSRKISKQKQITAVIFLIILSKSLKQLGLISLSVKWRYILLKILSYFKLLFQNLVPSNISILSIVNNTFTNQVLFKFCHSEFLYGNQPSVMIFFCSISLSFSNLM